MRKLGNKNAYTLGLEFQKTIVIFQISTLEFEKLLNNMKKNENPIFWTKNALFEYFWAGI